VDTYKTEEEQLEQLKGWLRENGRSLVLGVVVAVAAVFGWRGWHSHQAAQVEAASAQFQGLVEAVRQLDQPDASAEQRTTAGTLADGIKRDFPKSTYAQLAALLKAQLAVTAGDLDKAEQELNWVLAQKPTTEIAALTRLRLARLLHAAGKQEEALAQLRDGGSYTSAYEQVRGDILRAQGDLAGAREAYQRSKTLAAALQEPMADPLLDLKLRDLETAVEKGE
jgi:predicted negative regulator of RcsB-dependent stress response